MKTLFYYILLFISTGLCGTLYGQGTLPSGADMLQQLPVTGALKNGVPELKLFRQLFKPGIRFSGVTLAGDLNTNRSLISNDYFTTVSLLQYNISTGIRVEAGGIPVQAEFTRRESSPDFTGAAQKNWYKISFDAAAYKEKLQQLTQQFGPELLTRSGAQLTALKESFISQVSATYKEKAQTLLRGALDSISGGLDPLRLAGQSPETLKNQFFGQNLEGLKTELQRKLQETLESSLDAVKKDSVAAGLREKIKDIETKIAYVQQVVRLVEHARSSGLLKTMQELDGKMAAEYTQLLSNPLEMTRRLSDKFKFSGIEKIISLLSQFRLGGQQLPVTDNLNIPLLSRGVSFDIALGDKLIGFSMGRLVPAFNSLQLPGAPAAAVQDSAANRSNYWMLHFRKGLAATAHRGVQITSISGQGANNINYTATDFQKKHTRLLRLYSKERITGDNWLYVELAKSVTSSSVSRMSFSGRREKLLDDLFSWNNLSLKIRTEGVIEKAGISHQLYYTKNIGAPYPVTSNFFSTGGYEAGFMFRMKQARKKLSAGIRGSLRSFNSPGIDGSRWRNADIRGRIGYRFKNGRQLQISPSWHDGFKRYFLGGRLLTIRQQSGGVTGDYNLSQRLFGLYGTTFISAGLQQDVFPVTGVPGKTSATARSYSLLLNQSLLYGDHVLQVNAYYTKVSQDLDAFLYNTRLDADAGGQFRIGRHITAGLAVVYGYFKGAYTNIGVRPSFSGTLFKKLALDISGDFRKNITLQNPLFSQFANLNCMFRYQIK